MATIVKIFLKDSIQSLKSMVSEMRSSKARSLIKFSTDKCIEFGVVPKTFTGQVDLRINSIPSRKAFKKIYTTLYSHVLRKVPFLEFREAEEAEVHHSKMDLVVPLSKIEVSIPFSIFIEQEMLDEEHTTYKNIGTNDIAILVNNEASITKYTDLPSLYKYVSYLNTKAAINKCPLKLSIKTSVDHANPDTIPTTEPLTVLVNVSILVRTGSWYTIPNDVAESEEGDVRVTRNGALEYYSFEPFSRTRDNFSLHPTCSIFNIFTFFPEISSVIRTISRKSTFNENAYIV